MQKVLSHGEAWLVINGLRIAEETYLSHVKTMNSLVEQSGSEWITPEAAKRLAEEHQRNADETRAIINQLADMESCVINMHDD